MIDDEYHAAHYRIVNTINNTRRKIFVVRYVSAMKTHMSIAAFFLRHPGLSSVGPKVNVASDALVVTFLRLLRATLAGRENIPPGADE